MFSGRFLFHLIVFSMIVFPCSVSAGWLFGDDSEWDKSGLDSESGYDINTVITVNGRISEIRTDRSSDPDEPAIVVIQDSGETVGLVLGPKDFWSEKGIQLKTNDEITARGSKAQGQNGRIYVFVQSLYIPVSDTSVALRNASGRPVWSGRSGTGFGNGRHGAEAGRRFRGGRSH